jgi:hypothetical protein
MYGYALTIPITTIDNLEMYGFKRLINGSYFFILPGPLTSPFANHCQEEKDVLRTF